MDNVRPVHAERRICRQEDVAPVFERPSAGKGLQRLAPEDDGLSLGELPEAAKIGRNGDQQPVFKADAPVFRHIYDQFHLTPQIATGIFSSNGAKR